MPSLRNVFIVFLGFLCFFIFTPRSVSAEVVYFKEWDYPFSLNEQMKSDIGGKTGQDCPFTVEVEAAGEWTGTGGTYDSPPYAWGNDAWYPVYKCKAKNPTECTEVAKFSFTCTNTSFSLDQSSLPSYVHLDKEEDLFSNPPRKRYSFSVSESAPTAGSFNLPFSFSTTCQMKEYPNQVLTPKKPINPRKGSLSKTVNIGASCGPSPTPTPIPTSTPIPPTSTPIPTSTPVPTATPIPTSTPIPTATPTPSCNCDDITYSGTLAKGEKVTFTTYAKVENPATNRAQVLNMVYHVEKNGTEIANSGEIAASTPVQVTPTPSGQMYERYSTSWDWTIPAEGSGEVEYRVWVKINCGYKTAQAANTSVSVLAATTKKNESFFDLLFSFFGGLFGVTTATPTPTSTPTPTFPPTQPTVTPDVTLLVPTAQSLQLGTFVPPTPVPRVEKGCTWIKFWIKY